MQPKISVLVPFYNCEKYIAECIESIAKQSFTDYEIIFLDDGSTDKSAEIVSIALRAQRGIATAGHMNLSSIVALSGADFACAPDSFMSRLDGIQVLQAGKVKDRGRMQFHRQRRGGFCEPPRLRMIMERI